MVSIVSEKRRLWVLLCIVSLLSHASASAQNTESEELSTLISHASASAQNTESEELSTLVSDTRRVEKSLHANSSQGGSVFNVDAFGATGNGSSDDSKAFLAAWTAACATTSPSVFLIPQGKKYLVTPIKFNGPCKAPGLTVRIAGTVIAPSDPWNSLNQVPWLLFSNLQGLNITGGGIIDGSGQKWWERSCFNNPIQSCLKAPNSVLVSFCNNVTVRHLTFQNSPAMHIKFYASKQVKVSNLNITNPDYSPYTDGINVARSQQVVIKNSNIASGDDCVTIVTGSSDVYVSNIVCRLHGISIGSLGPNNSYETVSNVRYNDISLIDTVIGLRIKSWQGGSGYAQNISYVNVKLQNVTNPIIIDQYYCTTPSGCRNQTSAVQFSNLSYRKIHGTSATPEAIRFACSKTVPCKNILLEDIAITLNDGSRATTFVDSVTGLVNRGRVIPPT